MVLKRENVQVSVTLKKTLVEKIDEDAAKQMRTRSKHIAKIINDYYEKKGGR